MTDLGVEPVEAVESVPVPGLARARMRGEPEVASQPPLPPLPAGRVDVERMYLWAAWLSHGESIRSNPVRPAAIGCGASKLRELYRAMIDATRDGSWSRDGVDAWMRLVHARGLTIAAIELVGDFGELYDVEMLDAATCAAELEDAYQRRRKESLLLAELAELRAGAPVVPEEEAA